ncbi:lysozyme g-like isoform X1 [Gadus chalcogrammus]|uniref:lysozyme g-like isoform X1 n=1 Tax=Gadus chalcogrammus TaxID=1042646 RepID=UPI0024C3083A|nr:lysozyme g-like isoform X1 [Gadus chalcogrammus]
MGIKEFKPVSKIFWGIILLTSLNFCPGIHSVGYGDITQVETSGASSKTSRQDKLEYDGVRASHTMAQTDAERMERYRSIINNVAKKHHVDPAVIAAIISRESRAGNVIFNTTPPGWGDNYNGFGLMQVDKRYHEPRGAWNSEEHIDQATGILVNFIQLIQKKFPCWSTEQQLKGGIAAYNTGDGRVESYESVDSRTTGKDYSNDVVARAQWYKKNGF